MFIDEATYVRWAQAGKYDAELRFVSLVDGKQPLFVWLTTIAMTWIGNPLTAGRIVSILSGFVTMVGLFFLSFELFKSRWVGLVTSAFYVLFPFALVINRMALYESLVACFSVWSLYLAILLVRYLKTETAFILALVLGGSFLTKTSGFLNMYLLPVTLLVAKTPIKKIVFKWVSLVTIAIILAFLYYSVLFLSPLFYQIDEKNAKFVYHLNELFPYGAFAAWGGNLFLFTSWLFTYLTPFAFLFTIIALAHRPFRKEKTLLFLWFLLPLVALALFGRANQPRYIFFMIMPLLPIAAQFIVHFFTIQKSRLMSYGLIVLVASSMLSSDYKILTDFARSPIPKEDLTQYINSWSAGGGVREIVSYLAKRASEQKIYVATDGTYGSLPTTAIELYFVHNTNVVRQGFTTIPQTIPTELFEKAGEMPVYIIFNNLQNPPNWPMELIASYQKGISNYYIRLYKVMP